MKQFTKRFLTAFLILSACSSLTFANKCDRLLNYESGLFKSNVETDLVDGLWSASLQENSANLFFHEDGIVEIVSNDSQPVHKCALWQVEFNHDQPVLVISGVDGTKHRLRLYPTCDGFVIMDGNGHVKQMTKADDSQSLIYHQTKRQISGVWTIVTPGDFDIGREIRWDFNDDGSFTLAVAPDLYHPSHQGVWDLTPDGEYVVLYFTHTQAPESVYATELLKVKSVDYEDLLIDGGTMPRMLAEFKSNRNLHFIKDFNL